MSKSIHHAEGGMKVIRACDLPEPDTSYFVPWSLEMLYSVEPQLRGIADDATKQKRRRFDAKLEAYSSAKAAADKLIGWGARDPRLRSSGAWDCFFDHILDELDV